MAARSYSRPSVSNGTTTNNGAGAADGVAVSAAAPIRHRRHVVGGIAQDPSYAAAPSSSNSSALIASSATSDRASVSSSSSNKSSSGIPVPVAVCLWYILGVLSIASSKVLLTRYAVPPLVLTMQQLIVGMTLLRIMLEMQSTTTSSSTTGASGGEKEKDRGVIRRGGVRPVPIQLKDRCAGSSSSSSNASNNDAATVTSAEKCEAGILKRKMSKGGDTFSEENITLLSSLLGWIHSSQTHHIHNQLLLAAIYFALGFLLTNYGFMLGSAAFVETIKAAEPFTSASIAVLWGIERLGIEEILSLIGIAAGVTLSTLGHGKDTSSAQLSSSHHVHENGRRMMKQVSSTTPSLMTICFIVMSSNLCFSFRGLHQKLFRATPQGHVTMVDDLNLQYRMQQIGALMLAIPTLLENASLIIDKLQHVLLLGTTNTHAIQYILLSLTNGIAFTSYNLASTYVLTKISVVHHAALNCIRRVFAIVVTSIIFGLTITVLQLAGIGMAVAGFFAYIHFKMMKEKKDSRRKELRKKWGGFLLDEKSRKWNGKKSSSLLPLNNSK